MEYRRGVAAYAVALGLAGAPLSVEWIPPAYAALSAVSLETDDPVDDIRIDFESGWRAFLQAKRTLTAGRPLEKAVAQWVEAARSGLDPAKDRLVIVAGTLSGKMRTLQRALERGRTDLPGSPTRAEVEALEPVLRHLGDLDEEQRRTVLKCAAIWELSVEEPGATDSRQAIGYLRHIVDRGGHTVAAQAWSELTAAAGRAARLRGGYRLAGWLDVLAGHGITISTTGSTRAAKLELRRRALARFTDRTIRAGSEIDLRSLGAALPPVQLDGADAEVKVTVDPHDGRDESPLIWAFLRRGRAILTGLPGGGKSTALKQLAAQLASDPALPLPVYVSLREVDTSSSHAGLRDQVIELALRDFSPGDRQPLTDEINARLDGHGPIALLLDSLDETYDRSPAVVGKISRLMESASEDVCVLLATRDVAYKQADTLGWPSLRLGPPTNIMHTVTAVLETAARQNFTDESASLSWIEDRVAWVAGVLDHDEDLGQTPLMPVLLSLLAVKRSTGRLPTARAEILKEIVEDFLTDHELRLERDRGLGTLPDKAIHSAGLQAFATEATTILNSQGQATERDVVDAIATDLQKSWNLPPAQARVAARDAVRLLDEAGIFVLSATDAPVVPRITLLAEVGDALHITDHPEKLAQWVKDRITTKQFEPLVLACTLIPQSLAHAAAVLKAEPSNTDLANAVAQAAAEGAILDDTTLRLVCRNLIEQFAENAHLGWRAWDRLITLPAPADLLPDLQDAAAQHGPEHELLARATIVLRIGDPIHVADDPSLLKEILALQELPSHPSQNAVSNASLLDVQLRAATALLDHAPETASFITERAIDDAPHSTLFERPGLHTSLVHLLASRGFADQAQYIRETTEKRRRKHPILLPSVDESDYMHMLELITASPKTDLSTRQAVLLGELAEFLDTLQLDDGGSAHFVTSPDALVSSTIDVATALYGFDRQVLAAQASIALERVQQWGTMDAFWALFDQAQARDVDWAQIDNPAEAIATLTAMFTLGRGQAAFAAETLWEAPDTVAAIAAPRLRELLPRLRSSTHHQKLCALALASLHEGPEPSCWVSDDDPVLRAAAAWMLDPHANSYRLFLDDPDGHVRETAIHQIVEAAPSDLVTLLENIEKQPTPGWMCRTCRTDNPPNATSCSKDECFSGGANPSRAATKALAMIRK